MIAELAPKLSQAVAAWCKQQSSDARSRVQWESSSFGPDQVLPEVLTLLSSIVTPCVEVREAKPIDKVFLVESGSLSNCVSVAFAERREIRLWSLPKGDCLQIDPTGWAEDQAEIFVAGSGGVGAVARTLAARLGGELREM